MLTAASQFVHSILSKSNIIHHFRLNFPLTQVKIDSIAEQLRIIKRKSKPKIAISLNADKGPSKQYFLLYEQFRRLSIDEKIPINCFIQDQVTTQGFMLACCADRIEANPFSIIGDIGSYFSYINIGNLLKKYHIKYQNIGLSKGLFSKFSQPSQQQKGQQLVDNIQKIMIKTISQRRNISIDQILKIKGKLFNAEEALNLRLIDGFGSYPQWKLKSKLKSEQYPIGFSSFQLNWTTFQQYLFKRLFKVSNQYPLQLTSFIEQNNVIQNTISIILNKSNDESIMNFIEQTVAPILLKYK